MDFARLDNWPVEIRLCEGISEPMPQAGEGCRVSIQRNCTAECRSNRPQIVDPVNVIAVIVGNNHPMKMADFSVEQLLTKVRAAVDEDMLAAALDQDRRTQAPVARLIWIALTPLVADLGNAGRRPAAEDAD